MQPRALSALTHTATPRSLRFTINTLRISGRPSSPSHEGMQQKREKEKARVSSKIRLILFTLAMRHNALSASLTLFVAKWWLRCSACTAITVIVGWATIGTVGSCTNGAPSVGDMLQRDRCTIGSTFAIHQSRLRAVQRLQTHQTSLPHQGQTRRRPESDLHICLQIVICLSADAPRKARSSCKHSFRTAAWPSSWIQVHGPIWLEANG